MENVYYVIIKQYKGFFTKTHSHNAQLLVIPYGSQYAIHVCLGPMKDEKDTYITAFAGTFPHSQIDLFLHETSQDMILLDKLPAKIKFISPEEYSVSVQKKGTYIKSDLSFKAFNDKYYIFKGNINWVFNDVTIDTKKDSIKSIADKKMSIFKSIKIG